MRFSYVLSVVEVVATVTTLVEVGEDKRRRANDNITKTNERSRVVVRVCLCVK